MSFSSCDNVFTAVTSGPVGTFIRGSSAYLNVRQRVFISRRRYFWLTVEAGRHSAAVSHSHWWGWPFSRRNDNHLTIEFLFFRWISYLANLPLFYHNRMGWSSCCAWVRDGVSDRQGGDELQQSITIVSPNVSFSFSFRQKIERWRIWLQQVKRRK